MINHQDIDLDIQNYIKHKLNEIIVSRENTYENPEYDIEEDYSHHTVARSSDQKSSHTSSTGFANRPPAKRTKSEALLSLHKGYPEQSVQSAHNLLKSYQGSQGQGSQGNQGQGSQGNHSNLGICNQGIRAPIRSRQQSTYSLNLPTIQGNQGNQNIQGNQDIQNIRAPIRSRQQSTYSLNLPDNQPNPINAPITNLLEEWRIYCDIHSKMHNAALSYYKFLNRSIMLTSVIISAISSALSLTIVSRNKESEASSSTTTWLVVLNSAAVLSACLITIHRFLNLDEIQHLHDLYSDVHLCLSKDVQMNLALQQSHTPIFHSAEEMTKHVKSRLDTLIDKSPSIPQFIVDKVVASTREAYDFQGIQGPSIQAII